MSLLKGDKGFVSSSVGGKNGKRNAARWILSTKFEIKLVLNEGKRYLPAMIKPLASLVAASVILLTFAENGSAQILPIDLTSGSFNNDLILAGGADGITNNVQGGGGPSSPGYDYASATYGAAHGFTGTQLPDNGTIASGTGSGAVFQLQPYTQNNAAIVQGSSVTLTLTTPGKYSDISFLLNNLSSNAPATFTLNFTTGAPITVSTVQNVPYWVGGVPTSNPPLEFAGVAATFNPLEYGGGQDGTPINFDEYDFLINSSRLLSSITVNGANQVLDVYALSGKAVPEPSTYAMLLAGLALLSVAMRRKQQAALRA
jgi:hypothetical protein